VSELRLRRSTFPRAVELYPGNTPVRVVLGDLAEHQSRF
jgi:hypothetical protein